MSLLSQWVMLHETEMRNAWSFFHYPTLLSDTPNHTIFLFSLMIQLELLFSFHTFLVKNFGNGRDTAWNWKEQEFNGRTL